MTKSKLTELNRSNMFVQLGVKYKNGKIARLEQYTLKEIGNLLLPELLLKSEPASISKTSCSWLDKVFFTKKYQKSLKEQFLLRAKKEQATMRDMLIVNIIKAIISDD